MGKSRDRCRSLAAGAAVLAALSGAAPARADLVGGTAAQTPAPVERVVTVRRHGVRVPPGILAGVPSGGSPGGVRLRTVYPPYPAGFSADPYFVPPAVITVPPPIVFAPPPFFYGGPPIGLPFYGGCFVPSDFAGQHGYSGSCAEALYQQWTSRPF